MPAESHSDGFTKRVSGISKCRSWRIRSLRFINLRVPRGSSLAACCWSKERARHTRGHRTTCVTITRKPTQQGRANGIQPTGGGSRRSETRPIPIESNKCVGAEYKYTPEPDRSHSELLSHHLPTLDLCTKILQILCQYSLSALTTGISIIMSFRESYSNRPWEASGRGRACDGSKHTRGSYQGFSGRRPARGNYWPGKSVQTPSAEPPLGSLLSTLGRADLAKAAGTYESDSVITDCLTVTSYNWLDRTKPTIVVPGKHHLLFCSGLT